MILGSPFRVNIDYAINANQVRLINQQYSNDKQSIELIIDASASGRAPIDIVIDNNHLFDQPIVNEISDRIYLIIIKQIVQITTDTKIMISIQYNGQHIQQRFELFNY